MNIAIIVDVLAEGESATFIALITDNKGKIYFIKFVQEYSAACCGDELDICESMVVKAFKGA